jgi:hypothetical protein
MGESGCELVGCTFWDGVNCAGPTYYCPGCDAHLGSCRVDSDGLCDTCAAVVEEVEAGE